MTDPVSRVAKEFDCNTARILRASYTYLRGLALLEMREFKVADIVDVAKQWKCGPLMQMLLVPT